MSTHSMLVALLWLGLAAPVCAEEAKPAESPKTEARDSAPPHGRRQEAKEAWGEVKPIPLADLKVGTHYAFELFDGRTFGATVRGVGEEDAGVMVEKDGLKIPFELDRTDIANVYPAPKPEASDSDKDGTPAVSEEDQVRLELSAKRRSLEIKEQQIVSFKRILTNVRHSNRVSQIDDQRRVEISTSERKRITQRQREDSVREQLASERIQYAYAQASDLRYDISILSNRLSRIVAEKAAALKREQAEAQKRAQAEALAKKQAEEKK